MVQSAVKTGFIRAEVGENTQPTGFSGLDKAGYVSEAERGELGDSTA